MVVQLSMLFFLLIFFVFDSKSIFGTVFFLCRIFSVSNIPQGNEISADIHFTCDVWSEMDDMRLNLLHRYDNPNMLKLKMLQCNQIIAKAMFFFDMCVCVCVCVIEKESLIVMLLNSHRFNCVPHFVFADD